MSIGNLYSSVRLGPWQYRWGITRRSDLLGPTTSPSRLASLSTAHFSNKEDDYRIEFAFRGELIVPYLLPVSCVWNQVFFGSSLTEVGRAGWERVPCCLSRKRAFDSTGVWRSLRGGRTAGKKKNSFIYYNSRRGELFAGKRRKSSLGGGGRRPNLMSIQTITVPMNSHSLLTVIRFQKMIQNWVNHVY